MTDKPPIEKKIEDWASAEFRKLGCVVLKGKQDNSNDWPDRLILKPNDDGYFWIEFKRLGEEPRPSQKAKFKQLRLKGHRIYVCRTANDVQDCFELEMR